MSRSFTEEWLEDAEKRQASVEDILKASLVILKAVYNNLDSKGQTQFREDLNAFTASL